MTQIRRTVLRLLAFFHSGGAEADLAREIRAHLDLLEEQFIAQGMSADEARYAAKRAFGGVEQVKEHQRDARSFRWMAGWSMDLKLGARMLAKYPGLTLVGGCSMAFAIAIGAGAFEGLTQMISPVLPLQDGHRIVGIRIWNVEAKREEPATDHDFRAWRQELRLLDDIGGFRTFERNLILEDAGSEPIILAEISASAFRLARVPAMLGRPLMDEDEAAGAPPVLVIGHALWKRRFGGDSSAVGRTVRLGRTQATIVGVMPEGFTFPVAHAAWLPLRIDSDAGPRHGPGLRVFGRLADGTTSDEAQAALTTIAVREAAAFPETHAHLRPEVLPYAASMVDFDEAVLGGAAFNVFIVLFLVLICANVSALVFARAATRQQEILVRNALGASRGRIIMQLFAESLVLGGVAAAVGLAFSRLALRWWLGVFEADSGGQLPFWFDARLSPVTVFYVFALTLLGAAITGVMPALKVTGRRIEGQLRRMAGGTQLQMGGVWTVVIVAQVAVTVAFPAAAFFARQGVIAVQSMDVGFPADQYLSARLEMDGEPRARLETIVREFGQRLSEEAAVAGVTFTDRLPRTNHPARRIELDAETLEPAPAEALPPVSRAAVAMNFFEVMGAPILSGRAFSAAEAATAARVVVVNQSFVDRILSSRNPVGRRVRYAARNDEEASPWFEIVGVVKDLGMIYDDPFNGAGIYHPAVPAALNPIRVAVHVNGHPETFAQGLRAVAASIDPTLRLHEVLPLDKVGGTMWNEMDFLWRLLGLVSVLTLVLALVGIYSIMSFTVSRRTREIGIRLALGADARRIVTAIFSRALVQVGIGVLAGGLLVLALTRLLTGLAPKEIGVVAVYMALMLAVCLLACVVPTRRALQVQPIETLRSE